MLLALAGSYLLAQQSDASLLQRHLQDGERALGEKRYSDAAMAYEKARELDPETAEVHAKLGLIYFQQRKFEQAVPALRQALKLKPALPNADVLLAMSLSELGRHGEALLGLEKGFRRSADSALKRMAGLQLQRAYAGLQRDSKAVEVALELNRLYPEDAEVLYHTGRLFANFAYLTMRKLSQIAPDSVWRHQAAGDAYESQGNHDLAISEYREVLALDPKRPGIHFRLGRVYLAHSQQTNSQAEAQKEFERELQTDPTNANAAYELGEIHRKSGQLDKVREYFEIALKQDPDFEEAHLGLGRVLIDLGQPGLALPHLRKAIALDAENEVSYYRLWQVHKALGNATEQQRALAEFQRLHNRKLRQQEAGKEVFLLRKEVTKQELDPEVSR